MSWFAKGKEADIRASLDEQEIERNSNMPMRFFLKPDETKQIMFLPDDEGFYFKEHHLCIRGKWGYYEVCLKDVWGDGYCPACEIDNRPYGVKYLTIVCLTPYTTKKGKIIPVKKFLFPATSKTRKKLSKQLEKRGSLGGCIYDVTRTASTEPRVGDDFEFIEKVDNVIEYFRKLKLPPEIDPVELSKPYVYDEIFKPKTVKEMQRMLSLYSSKEYIGSIEDEEEEGDEVPF